MREREKKKNGEVIKGGKAEGNGKKRTMRRYVRSLAPRLRPLPITNGCHHCWDEERAISIQATILR